MQAATPRLVLASASPARRTLLEAAGLHFSVEPAACDEAAIKRALYRDGAPADAVALALATAKARAIPAPGAVVIGADQILICEGVPFDKPADMDTLMEQLLQLRGRTHTLVTAVTCWQDGVSLWQDVARPILAVRAFSPAFLEGYLVQEGPACLSCVGGYRFEGLGQHLFDGVDGEHAAILGLPMLALLRFLRRHGVLAD